MISYLTTFYTLKLILFYLEVRASMSLFYLEMRASMFYGHILSFLYLHSVIYFGCIFQANFDMFNSKQTAKLLV